MKKIQELVNIFLLLAVLCTIPVLKSAIADDSFPYRGDFDVEVVEIEDLNAQYDDFIIVDVRSSFEFNVVHIAKAINISISKATFGAELEKVRGKTDAQKIAFYCNGHTCKKSYKATKKAKELGFENIYAFDAGIFDWIKVHPDKGVLVGETPVRADKIISKDDFDSRLLSFDEFSTKAGEAGSMVIDVREPFQRDIIPEIAKIRNIPLDRLLGLLKKGRFKNKHLLIFDAVGKQVKWLQYHFEANGYTDYLFLEKGVAGIE